MLEARLRAFVPYSTTTRHRHDPSVFLYPSGAMSRRFSNKSIALAAVMLGVIGGGTQFYVHTQVHKQRTKVMNEKEDEIRRSYDKARAVGSILVFRCPLIVSRTPLFLVLSWLKFESKSCEEVRRSLQVSK